MATRLRELAKKIAFRYAGLGKPRYEYNVDPSELAALVRELDRVKDLQGSIVEVGVARGMTTRFLCEHLVRSGRTGEALYAVDTFGSFHPEDVRYEVDHRGKAASELAAFAYNDVAVWRKNFRQFPFVTACQADCGEFDYASIAPIKLAFVDVDLYQPTRRALPRIYEQLCAGGELVVDDVRKGGRWDGAYEAFTEFCAAQSLAPEWIGGKCGAVRKP